MEVQPIGLKDIRRVEDATRYIEARIKARVREIGVCLDYQRAVHGAGSPVYQRINAEGQGALDALKWASDIVRIAENAEYVNREPAE
jgi:hypothetical protein